MSMSVPLCYEKLDEITMKTIVDVHIAFVEREQHDLPAINYDVKLPRQQVEHLYGAVLCPIIPALC